MSDDLRALRAAVERFPIEVTAQLRSVAFRTSRTAMALAKARVAVDTGYTRDNIHIIEEPEKKQFLVVPGTDRPRVTISLHTDTRSGRQHTQRVTLNMLPDWLEYGTVKMPARPFMRPAADAVEAIFKSEMVEVATKAAERLVK